MKCSLGSENSGVLKNLLGASYLSKLGRGGQYGPEAQDQVFSLDAVRVIGGLDGKQREQVTSQETSQPSHQPMLRHLISSKAAAMPITAASLAPACQPGYHSSQLNTAQPRFLPTLPSHLLEGTQPPEKTSEGIGCGTGQMHSLE